MIHHRLPPDSCHVHSKGPAAISQVVPTARPLGLVPQQCIQMVRLRSDDHRSRISLPPLRQTASIWLSSAMTKFWRIPSYLEPAIATSQNIRAVRYFEGRALPDKLTEAIKTAYLADPAHHDQCSSKLLRAIIQGRRRRPGRIDSMA